MKRNLLIEGIRYGTSNSRPYIMPWERSVNIDTEIDFLVAEILLKRHEKPSPQPVPGNP